MKSNTSLTVQQKPNDGTIKGSNMYVVLITVNTTVHKIGERLSKSEIDSLISRGYKVTIK